MTSNHSYGVTTDEIMDFLKENVATKHDLVTLEERVDQKFGKLRSDFIDYLDKRLIDLKGDLIVIMKSEDRKVSALIELLAHKKLISSEEAQSLIKMEPFPQRI